MQVLSPISVNTQVLSPATGAATPPASPPLIPPALTPQGLAENFTEGMRTGAPMSLVTGDAVAAALPVHPSPVAPVPAPPPVAPVEAQAPASVEYATPQPATADPAYQPVIVGQSSPPPVAPAASPPVVPAPAALPSYGSDLRPVTPTAPPPLPPALPAAAAAGPAAGHGLINQPAVVRQPATTAPPASASAGSATAPAGAAAYAVAGGATVGALAEDQAGRGHLQRLIDAVARQQPRLAWAIGERRDGGTVIVTDLACGWLPPGIEIPATAAVLEPQHRRRNLEELLGAVTRAATHAPGRHIAADPEPVNLSTRPVRAPQIDELGWRLGRATQWRDGLPRLAHTLARAAATGTGVLDSEIEMLGQHLQTLAATVLSAYPHADPRDIGNWQLLAAIEALAGGRSAAANYHLAWFLVLADS